MVSIKNINKRLRQFGAALLIASLVIGIVPITPAHAATTTTKYLNGKIAFSRSDPNPEIYTMDPDGTNQINISNLPAFQSYGPRWSSDGTKIAFTSDRDGNYESYTMNADGSNQTRLTNSSNPDYSPTWSPDGSKIAFAGAYNGASSDQIYTMNIDGSNITQVTNNSAASYAPDWSPDGTKIIFKSDQTGNSELYAIDVNGTNQVNLTNNASNDGGAHWSPDGTKISFWSNRSGGGSAEIYTMNADGSNVVRLTNSPFDDRTPRWSPDSSQIVFSSNRDGNYEIYTMNTDGTNVTRLTNNALFEGSPSWQPLPYQQTLNDNGTITSTISASQNYTATDYAVQANETLVLDGSLCDVVVQSGATLMGTGHACTITVQPGGTIAPGHSPGCLTSGNLSLAGTYNAELGGTTPCTGYDQLQVTGTVTVGGSLSVSLINGFAPAVGSSFTLIDNDAADPVTGTFAGLAEGATITLSGYVFKISYVGGTGNDVVLTTQSVPNTPTANPTAPNTGTNQTPLEPSLLLVVAGMVTSLVGVRSYTKRRGYKISSRARVI